MRLISKTGAALATLAAVAAVAPAAAVAAPSCVGNAVNGSCTFSTVGPDSWTIPAGVSQVQVEAFGAAGGNASPAGGGQIAQGGKGGRAVANLAVSPGDPLVVVVGGIGSVGLAANAAGGAGGSNGGGSGGVAPSSSGGGGGGGTDVRVGGSALNNRAVIAGGGGGGGGWTGPVGGGGGGLSGEGDTGSEQLAGSGDGGTQSAGGPGGFGLPADGLIPAGTAGSSGSSAVGGNGGGASVSDPYNSGGGGGGGGLYGGGGGGSGLYGGGGGGGSGFGPAGTTYQNGIRSGNGLVTISWGADLSITNTDGATQVTPGTSTTYTVTASNAGPFAAVSATVKDAFPLAITATWTCVGAAGGACTASGSGNINDPVTLPAGASVTYTITAAISPAVTGTLSNIATVGQAAGIDLTPSNNAAGDADALTPSADLAVTTTDGASAAVAGAQATYTITASNAGPSNAPGALVASAFSAGIASATWTCVGAGGGICPPSGSADITSTVNLPAGASVTFTVIAEVSRSAAGSITSTASVASGVPDPAVSNNSATDTNTITRVTNLSVTKTNNTATTRVGGSTTYEIVVANAGPSDATAARLTDTLPTELTGATWTCAAVAGASCGNPSGAGDLNETADLPPGGTATYTVVADVKSTAIGTLSNTATVVVGSDQSDPSAANNSATDTDGLIAPGVTITPAFGDFGQQLVGSSSAPQTFTVRNSGTDELVIDDAGLTLDGQNVAEFTLSDDTCSGETIAVGDDCAFKVTFKPAATGTRSAAVRIPTDAFPFPSTVGLSGTGTNPPVVPTPDEPKPATPSAPAVAPPAPKKVAANLQVFGAVVRGGRLQATVSLAKEATGTLVGVYRARGTTTLFQLPIPEGQAAEKRLRLSLRLSKKARGGQTGILTLAYAGNDAVGRDAARVRAATVQAKLKLKAAGIREGKLTASGTITSKARGIVRLRLSFVKAGKIYQRTFGAKIKAGHWSLSTALPSDPLAEGRVLAIRFSGDRRAGIFGQQLTTKLK